MELEETEPPVEPKEPPSDAEFEGEGDYEEGMYADWWQEPDAKGDEAEAGQWLESWWRDGDRRTHALGCRGHRICTVGAGTLLRGLPAC